MSRIYAYARCSHIDSAISGLSIESQSDAIKKYAQAIPATWGTKCYQGEPGFFIDPAQSAWKKKLSERPAGKELLEVLRPGDHLVIYSLDRGFRSVYDFANTMKKWEEMGVIIHLVSEQFNLMSANGKLLANIFAAFAQWKSDVMSERARVSKKKRKAKKKSRQTPKWLAVVAPPPEEKPPTVELPGVVYSYARVSHLDSLSGGSLVAQKSAVDQYAKSLNRSRGKHFEERAVSAYSRPFRNRPEGKRLDSALKPGDHVVFSRLDRGWRSLQDLVSTVTDWRDRGITVHLADTMLSTSSKSGDMFLKIMAMLAEWEASFISERTKMAMAALRKKGLPVNQQVPMGARVKKIKGNRYFVLDKETVRIMWFITHLRDKHGMSWDRISDCIEEGLAKKEGRRPIPRGGIETRKNTPPTPRTGHLKVKLLNRKWTKARCHKAYQRWPQVREMLKNIKYANAADLPESR